MLVTTYLFLITEGTCHYLDQLYVNILLLKKRSSLKTATALINSKMT